MEVCKNCKNKIEYSGPIKAWGQLYIMYILLYYMFKKNLKGCDQWQIEH